MEESGFKGYAASQWFTVAASKAIAGEQLKFIEADNAKWKELIDNGAVKLVN